MHSSYIFLPCFSFHMFPLYDILECGSLGLSELLYLFYFCLDFELYMIFWNVEGLSELLYLFYFCLDS